MSPSLVVALVALFFAVSGSTLAFAAKKKPAPPAQARCAVGAVRAIAEITGQPGHGVANVPGAYTSDTSYFGQVWNCTGGSVQAERLNTGDYYVKFGSNTAATAVVSGMNGDRPVAANVARDSDGSFHITLGTPSQPYDAPFVIVAF